MTTVMAIGMQHILGEHVDVPERFRTLLARNVDLVRPPSQVSDSALLNSLLSVAFP